MQLGRFGVWTTYRTIGEESAPEAARLVESLGYGAFWLGGSPQLPDVRPLLARASGSPSPPASSTSGSTEPGRLAAEYAELAREFPERLLLGIGIGHPEATSEYAAPLAKMRSFFDGLDAAEEPVPRQARCAAALAPRMLELSAERALGAHTYFVPVEHTRATRELLGEGPLIATELACVLDADVERARASARGYAELYLGLRNYTTNLRRFGFGDEDLGGAAPTA